MKKRSLFLLVWCCISGSVFAQDNDSTHYIEEISVIASRKFIPVLKTLDYIHLSGEELLKYQGNTLAGSLERIPGLSSINTGTGIAKPVIRGLSLNRIIVNEYGIKQEGQQWGLDHGLEIDQYNVHQLEIIKGPVSLLYGSDGIGGVINILPAPILPVNTMKAEVILNYKSNNDLFGTSVAMRANRKNVFTDFRITYQEFADYKVPAETFTYNSYILPIYSGRLKNTAGNDLNMSGLIGMKRNWGKTSIYISNVHQHAGFFIGAFGAPKAYLLTDDGDNRSIDLPKQVINHFKLVSNTQLKTKNGFIELDLGYQNNNRQELSLPHAHGYGPVPEGNLALKLELQTLSATIRTPLLSSEKWKILSGLNAQFQQNKRGGYEFLIPDFLTFSGGIHAYAAYTPSNRWVFSSGIRFDAAYQEARRSFISLYNESGEMIGKQQRSPDIHETYSNVSGSVGTCFAVSEKSDLKLDIGSAFRVPTMVELTSNGVHHGTFRHEMGVSSLRSERGYMLNLNYHYRSKKVTVAFSPFVNYFENYIYLRPSAKFSPLPDAGQIYQYTEGKALFAGAEFSTRWKMSKWLSSDLGMEYVYNQNLDLVMPLPFTPPFSVREEVEFTPVFNVKSFQNTYFTLIGHYFAAQNRTDINEPSTNGYFLLHFSAGSTWILNKNKLGLGIQVRNMTNTKYLNNMSRYRMLNLPEQGINFNLILRYEFG
ncbi:putative TonB-dependent receptor precursor [compost metagenome]